MRIPCIKKRIEAQVGKKVKEELGNKSLFYVSRILRAVIVIKGPDKVRKELIKGVEGDMKRAVKKNPSVTVEELIAPALSTPEYMALLDDLGMNIEHLRVLAKEALGVSSEQ